MDSLDLRDIADAMSRESGNPLHLLNFGDHLLRLVTFLLRNI